MKDGVRGVKLRRKTIVADLICDGEGTTRSNLGLEVYRLNAGPPPAVCSVLDTIRDL
jgi:hypothetical protein